MFLIEYSKNKFINGERVDWIGIDESAIVSFTIEGDSESEFFTDTNLSKQFLNNMQAIDHNNCLLESRYDEIINKN